ncbi:hypothetical protein QLR68_36310, partial [Micromonospora sp. DH15]|nr:hypothetical protein [Micromonospora sp. DH15]
MSTPREHPTGPAADHRPAGDGPAPGHDRPAPADDRPAPGEPASLRNGSHRRGADGRFRPRDTPEAADAAEPAEPTEPTELAGTTGGEPAAVMGARAAALGAPEAADPTTAQIPANTWDATP